MLYICKQQDSHMAVLCVNINLKGQGEQESEREREIVRE
jgi:hypothetical protein